MISGAIDVLIQYHQLIMDHTAYPELALGTLSKVAYVLCSNYSVVWVLRLCILLVVAALYMYLCTLFTSLFAALVCSITYHSWYMYIYISVLVSSVCAAFVHFIPCNSLYICIGISVPVSLYQYTCICICRFFVVKRLNPMDPIVAMVCGKCERQLCD